MTIKCANCENDAIYTCADPGVDPVNYCRSCLPPWLEVRAGEGHFPLMTLVPEKTSKKKAVVEEPVVETPVVDEPAVEAPADASN